MTPALPAGYKLIKDGGAKKEKVPNLPPGYVLVAMPKDDLANLPPEVQERVRGHRAALEGAAAQQAARDEALRQPTDATGVPGGFQGQPMSPERLQAVNQGAQTMALTVGSLAAGGPAMGVMGRLPGLLGRGARALATPTGLGIATGIQETYRTGNPLRGAIAGGATTLGLRGLRTAGGVLGRLARMRGVTPRAVPGASPASPSPAPVRAAPMQSPPTAATPVAAPVVNPNAARLQQQQAALSRGAEASEFEMAGARPTLGRMPSARPAPKPAQSSASHPVGGSSVDGGTTAASAPKTPKIRPIPSKPKDPDGWQPIKPLSDKGEYEARLKAFRARLNQPLDPLTEKMAQDVIRLHQAGSSTPAKSPGQIAAYLSEQYGAQVARGDNALSPHMARQFVDLVLKGAN